MEVNYKKLNPLGFHLMNLLQDAAIRFIILYGGSSSGKTYSVAQMILIMTLWDGANTLIMRKVGASISKTIYEDFKVASVQLGIRHLFRFKDGCHQIVCIRNGAKIDFGGLDDPEKIKGISNYKRIVLDEWSEFWEEDYKQIRKRLRGKKGQQIITTFNPIKETHWIKKKVFDKEKWHDLPMTLTIGGRRLPPELTRVKSIRTNEPRSILNPRTKEIEDHAPDMVVIQTTYLNNFWVVGSPDGTYGFYDEQCIADFERDRVDDPDYYNVYALGEWGVIRTGFEFFGSFNRGVHVREIAFDRSLPIHLSVDNNVLPYISFSLWQIDTTEGMHIRQIGEICAESPDNTVRKASKMVARRLRELSDMPVYLHGDASTRAANTFDDEKRSWLDLLIEGITGEGVEIVDCVGKQNPSVPMSGEFINAIFDNVFPDLSIAIDEKCVISIEDYMSVQKDVNGAILKTKVKNKITGQTYEEHGHLSDTFRYLVCDVLKEEFARFSQRRKRNLYARDGAVSFYNPGTDCTYSAGVLYTMPNINGKFGMVYGRLCGENWHIVEAALCETSSTQEIKERILRSHPETTIIECPESYYRFVRELRSELKGVRVLKETSDIDRRIAATSDYVRTSIRFNETALTEDPGYNAFITNLLDYRKDSVCKEASAVLSGFIRYVVKSFSKVNSG